MNNLRRIRQLKNSTQKKISSNANITERAYQMYEYGEREPKVRTAIRIAKALNTTVEELWDGNPTK